MGEPSRLRKRKLDKVDLSAWRFLGLQERSNFATEISRSLFKRRNRRDTVTLFDKKFLDQLVDSVEKLEAVSSVELVVVAGPCSGNYVDIDRQNGFLASALMLLVAVYSPWHFAPEMLLLWTVVAYVLGIMITPKLSVLRWHFTTPTRRQAQVNVAARNYFFEKRISYTRDRTGLMLYLSHFEKRGVLLTDAGIEAKVSRSVFNELEHKWAQCKSVKELEEAVLKGLEDLRDPLAEALPRAEDDVNELPNEVCLVTGGAS